MKKCKLITYIAIGLSFWVSNINAQVPCNNRLIKNVDFTYNGGGVEPARWNMSQIDPNGFSIDQVAYAYLPTGNFSNQNIDWQNPNINKNTIRQYAIVRNPKDLSPQYADISTDGMIVINPRQGENDQYGQFQIANLQPGQTYYVEIKFYNVISLASRGPNNQCYSWCNWNNELNILWEGNGNNAHDGQSNMTWSGVNGTTTTSGNWDGWGNQISNWMWVSPAGSYAIMRGQMTLGNATTGFAFTFLKKDGSATNPIVLGIDYIKIYGCQAETINVSGGTNSVCEATELTLTAQGLGSAGSTYAWYKDNVLLSGRTKDTLQIVSPIGSGSTATYRAEGEWSNKSVTLTSKMCCNSVGGTNDEVIRQSFNGLTYTCVPGRSGGYADIPDKNVKNFIDPAYIYAGATCNSLNDGQYAVIQSSFAGDFWRNRPEVKDHTGVPGSGALFINAVGGVGQIFYKFNLDGLCNGTMYEFSAWYASLALGSETKPSIEFAVMNGPTKVDYVTTGVIPENSKWYQAAVTFITPSTGNPTYTLQLSNLVTGSSGNDLMIDDIVVKKCTPKIDLYPEGGKEPELIVCSDAPVKLKVNTIFDLPFIVTGSSSGTVYYQWMEATSPTGPWALIGVPETSGTYNAIPTSTSKYYRAKVSKAYATAANGIPPLATDCGNDGMTSVFKLTKGGDLTINVTGNTAYCVGDNMSLVGDSGAGVKWGWMKGNDTIPTFGLSNDVSKKTLTRTFASADAGNYYFVVRSVTGCDAKFLLEVTQKSTPTLSITNPATVCSSNTVNLTAAAVTEGSTVGLTYTYWTDADATVALSTPSAVTASGTYYIKGTITGSCPNLQQVVVNIWDPLTATIGKVDISMNGLTDGSITVSGITGGSGQTLEYRVVGTETVGGLVVNRNYPSSLIDFKAGTYTLYARNTDQTGCEYNFGTVVIVEPPPITATISNTNVLCNGTSTAIVTVSDVNGGTPDYDFQLEKQSGAIYEVYIPYSGTFIPAGVDKVFNSLPAGTYRVRIKDQLTELIIGSATITEPTAVTVSTSQRPLCILQPVNVEVTISGGTGAYEYQLNGAGNWNPIVSGDSLLAQPNITYSLAVRDANGCTTANPIQYAVTVEATPNTPSVKDYSACLTTGTVKWSSLILNASGGNLLWHINQTGGTPVNPSDIDLSIIGSSVMYASVISSFGCESPRARITANINSNPKVSVDQTDIYNILIDASNGQAPYNYSINNITGTLAGQTNVGMLTFGIQQYKIIDANGCKADTIFYIDPIKLYPDKYFSPNDDGINNLWNIKNLEFYPNTDISIFDRYGKLLFKSKSIDFNGWDGKFRGKPVPSADYWYVIEIRETGQRLTGHFLLKR